MASNEIELGMSSSSLRGHRVADAHLIAMHNGRPSDADIPGADKNLDPDTLFFSDGIRRVDFVLVYQTGSRSFEQKKAMRRTNMEEFLLKEGLQFEIDSRPLTGLFVPGLDDIHRKLHVIPGMDRLHPHPEDHYTPITPTLCFMKIHATWNMLTKYADIMKLKMPLIKGNENQQGDEILRYFPNPFRVDRNLLPEVKEQFTSFFSEARIDQFDITDREAFFSPAQRSEIV